MPLPCRSLGNAGTLFEKLEERERHFVIDSGASMHMLSESQGESETLKKRKFMCMIIFSSLCSCSRILCRNVPWQALQRAHSRLTKNGRDGQEFAKFLEPSEK